MDKTAMFSEAILSYVKYMLASWGYKLLSSYKELFQNNL